MVDVRSLYEGIINEQGGLAQGNALKPSGTSYYPNDGTYGYNAETGEYEKKRPGVAYVSVKMPEGKFNALRAAEQLADASPSQPAEPNRPDQALALAATGAPTGGTAPVSAPGGTAAPAALSMPSAPRPAPMAQPSRYEVLQQYRARFGPNVGMSLGGNVFLNDPQSPTGYRILGRVDQPASEAAPLRERYQSPEGPQSISSTT